MKVALLGNMNNNNFSMMRYFRDLGVDAHLVLFLNDGFKSTAHFIPENDTWELAKWGPFIHQTNIFNWHASVLAHKFPFNILFFVPYFFFKVLKKNSLPYKSVSAKAIREQLGGYDAYIGSGLSAALLQRIGVTMDVFYPYGTGVEYLGARLTRKSMENAPFFKRIISRKTAEIQKKALRKVRFCASAEISLTKKTFDEIGVDILPLAIPMVYNREPRPSDHDFNYKLSNLKKEISQCDITILSHSRQMWVNSGEYTSEEWDKQSKHNEWLINSYAKFLKERPNIKAKLYILEYGPDVNASKDLCKELAIQEHVSWLPKMTRKELMFLISLVDIGTDQFSTSHGSLWGGSAWEVLASGKPLLQSFMFSDEEFKSIFGYPPPPMLRVKQEACILNHLLDMADNPDKGRQIGEEAKIWFNQYNGISLAQKWLDLLQIKKPESK